MAILSKIRDRSVYLILIVGMALFAFVLDPSSIESFFSANKVNAVGTINGEDIDRETFAAQVESYRTQSGNKASQMQAVNAVWNSMLAEEIFKTQLENAGIVVGEKDIWDAMIALPEVQNSPLFRNEANLFNEEKLKEYIANMKDEADAGNTQAWLGWLATEKRIKQDLQRKAYTSLVTAGLGVSLEEGKRDYFFANTTIDAQYVYVPYTSVPDSLVTVSTKDVRKYVENNPNKYKQEASRSLQYIKFDIVPSKADEEAIEQEVAKFVNDHEEYSNAAKGNVIIAGFKNTKDNKNYLEDNNSDINYDNAYKYQSELPLAVAKNLFNAKVGTVFGPYKDNGYYKLSKLVETTKLPDSVKSSHIIVPFLGATGSTSTKTKEAAKKTIDSLFAKVKRSKRNFAKVANQINTDGTKGKDGSIGWVRKNNAFSPYFDSNFANFIYKNSTGSVGIVESAYGYHIIRIDAQKNTEKAVKLATFARSIEASETTENIIFEQAETLAADLASGKTMEDISKEKGYNVQSALNLKVLEEDIPGLSNQRQIVTWAFKSGTELGNSKRFDIDYLGKRGYAVVTVNGKTEKDAGLSASDITRLQPTLRNNKKAALIATKMEGATLNEIAKNNQATVQVASLVTLASPTLSGVGNEPAVVGVMSTIKLNELSTTIIGKKGVFVVQVIKRTPPAALENYDNFRNNNLAKLKGKTYQMYQALQETADVNDNRGSFY